MQSIPFSKKQIILLIVIILIIIAIPVGIYLVQRTQVFKPRADTQPGSWAQAFEFKDGNGKPINCDYSTDPPVCTTDTSDINVRVKPEHLDLLQ